MPRGKRKHDQEQTSYFGAALESKTLDIRLHDTVKYLLCNFRWEAKSENLLLVMLVVVTILVGGGPWVIREAHCIGPVIQVVEITGYRTRFDNANPAFVRYLLIDPSNADPTIDGFAPIDPIGVLMLFIGGDGTLNPTFTQQTLDRPIFWLNSLPLCG